VKAALLLPAALLLAGCPKKEARPTPSSAALPTGSALYLSADMRGYLGPCGCSENMQGGLPRAAKQLEDARKELADVLFFDAGDSLFRQAKLSPAAVPQERRKAQAIADLWKQMGLQARAVGELDQALGEEFRKSLGLPELASGEPRLFTLKDGHQVGVVSGDTIGSLQAGVARARSAGAGFVAGLVHASAREVQQAAAAGAPGVDLLVASHAESEMAGEENRLFRGPVPVLQLQSKGRSLARVELSWNGEKNAPFTLAQSSQDAEKALAALDERVELLRREVNEPGLADAVKTLKQAKLEELIGRRQAMVASPVSLPAGKNVFSVRFVVLESTLPSSDSARALVTAYDRDVGELNLAYAREHGQDCPKPGKKEAAFVGNESCRECHDEAFPVWEASKHAHAYETLEAVGKQFHLDCIGCHVTGMNQPGGVCRIDRVDGRKDVGCESCHGPGSLHADSPTSENIVTKFNERSCRGCHDPENSPHFEFSLYLPKVLGPGHAAKK